jgi:Na+/melibiose symporter-like transporter
MANAAGSLEERRLGRTFLSGLHAAFSFGAACAVGVTYLLNGPARYNLAFIVAGVVCLLGAAVSLRLPVADGLPMNEDGVENHDLRPIAVVAAVLAFVVVVGSFTVDTTLEGFSALFIRQIASEGPAQSAVGLAALYLAGALGRTVADRLVRIWGDWRALLGGIATAAVGTVLLTWSDAVWGTVVGMLLIGIGLSPAAPVAYAVRGRSRENDIARATGRLTTAGYATFVLAPLLIGVVGQESLTDAFRLLPIVLALMALATLWFGWRQRRATPRSHATAHRRHRRRDTRQRVGSASCRPQRRSGRAWCGRVVAQSDGVVADELAVGPEQVNQ